MDRLTTRQVIGLFDPWPIILPKAKWRLRVIKVNELSRFYGIWKWSGERKTIKWWAKYIESHDWEGKRHHIRSRIRSNYIPRAIIVWRKMVIDGNHGAISLVTRNYKQPILIVEALK